MSGTAENGKKVDANTICVLGEVVKVMIFE
jgi:hypothetical protein